MASPSTCIGSISLHSRFVLWFRTAKGCVLEDGTWHDVSRGAGVGGFFVAFLASFAKSNTEEQKKSITSNTQEQGEVVSDSIAEEQYDYVPDSDRTKVK